MAVHRLYWRRASWIYGVDHDSRYWFINIMSRYMRDGVNVYLQHTAYTYICLDCFMIPRRASDSSCINLEVMMVRHDSSLLP